MNAYFRFESRGEDLVFTRFLRIPRTRVRKCTKKILVPVVKMNGEWKYARWTLWKATKDYNGRPDTMIFRLDGRSVRYMPKVKINETERNSEV